MKEISNGKGTNLTIGYGEYISIGKNGNNITVRGNGKVIAFDTWEQFIEAIDVNKAAYYKAD